MTALVDVTIGGLADLDGVMAVMECAFDPRYGESWTSSQCAGLLPLPGVWLTIARTGDQVIGFSLSRFVVGEAELLLLGVRPRARRRGVGKSLLDHFIAASLARGAVRLHLEVRDGNDALQLYFAAGFAVVGRRRSYYKGRDDMLYDALSLARAAPMSSVD